MDLSVVWQKTLEETLLLLRAPLIEPEMLWIITPLFVTFLVMTFYFGLYREEELGWNTAVSNTLVLMFVFIDLLRTMYHYTEPPTIVNFVNNLPALIVIFIVIIEAILLFFSAFSHAWPKKIMFFIASPMPVILQAYVITAVIYLRVPPNWYTLLSAILMFIVLFTIAKALQMIQRGIVWVMHEWTVHSIKKMKDYAKELRSEARRHKGEEKKELQERAKEIRKKAQEKTEELKETEKKQYGELKAAKKL